MLLPCPHSSAPFCPALSFPEAFYARHFPIFCSTYPLLGAIHYSRSTVLNSPVTRCFPPPGIHEGYLQGNPVGQQKIRATFQKKRGKRSSGAVSWRCTNKQEKFTGIKSVQSNRESKRSLCENLKFQPKANRKKLGMPKAVARGCFLLQLRAQVWQMRCFG